MDTRTSQLRTRLAGFAPSFCILLLAGLSLQPADAAFPAKLGDLVGNDANATPFDLARLINHLHGTPRLSVEMAVFADMNQDGVVNETDADLLADAVVGNTSLPDVPLNRPYETSPSSGESGIAVTRETVFRLVQPLGTNALVTTTSLYAEFGGRRLLCRCELSSDRRTVTLFYLENLPGSARVRVTFDGSGLTDFLGRPLDLDGDSQPGGVAKVDFDTLSLSPLAGTAVIGHVYASDPVPISGSSRGNEAQTNQSLLTSAATQYTDRPLAGVTITVDGMEQDLRAVTDTNGYFRLEPVPPGHFFVHIDGRTAVGSQWPNGSYYPVVGKSWDAVAGRTNTLAGGTGEIFLPLVTVGTLQTVSATNDTMITFPPSVLSNNTNLAGVSIMVPANSLFSENGNRGGRVGIAPVPPDRLPGQLPPGLEFPLVITVQTDGAGNFDRPVPACFPNLPDPVTGQPLPPGTRNWLYSFNHDTGEWEAIGPMTVSEDGRMICTDPGVGILAPGWHGSGPDPDNPCRDCPRPDCDSSKEARCKAWAYAKYAGKIALAIPILEACVLAARVNPIKLNACRAAYIAAVWKFAEELFKDLKSCECPEQSAAVHRALLAAPPVPTVEIASGIVVPVPEFNDPTMDGIFQRLVYIGNLWRPYNITGDVVIPESFVDQVLSLHETNRVLAGSDIIAYGRSVALRIETDWLLPEIGYEPQQPGYSVLYLAEVMQPSGEILELRGRTRPFTQYSLFVPRGGQLLRVTLYDTTLKAIGIVFPFLTQGLPYEIPNPVFVPINASVLPDFDGDGLVNEVERVYGTNPEIADTDGDGINDGAEVDAGTDPLDGLPARTGIINTVRTPAPALDVCAVNDVAIVAQGNGGVSVVNVVNGQNPVIIAQVDTPGFAQSVTCSGNLIAVADGAAGLAIIDLTDPPAARIARQLNLGSSATTIAAGGGIAYVGLASGQLVAVDMPTGTILATINAGGAIHDLGLAGDSLFVLRNDQLRAYSLTGGFLDFQGSVSISGIPAEGITGRKRLFVGSRIAYATSYPGYDTIDVSDPRNLRRIGSAQDVGPNSFKQIVDNGSGLGVAAVGVNPRDDGTHDVSLYDVSNPTNTTRFLTQFLTPGLTRALSIYNGLAYVADSSGGLQVVNYRAYDSQGVPPTITLTTSFPPGIAEEGKLMRLTANVSDDVQVRNVEFYVDGVRVLTDGNFPFEHRFVTPALTVAKTNFTIRAKATDTGGNIAWTSEALIVLTPDMTPPRVLTVLPSRAAIVESVNTILALFNEPLDPTSVKAASVVFTEAGSDGILETQDDSLIGGGFIEYREAVRGVLLSFPGDLAQGLYKARVNTNITDVAGNALAGTNEWTFRVAHLIYSNDFQIAAGLGWSTTSRSTTPEGGRRFLGTFENSTVSLTLTNLPPHADISLSFELFIIRSWDGNTTGTHGPDIWDLRVTNGPTLLRTTFSQGGTTQAYPGMYPGSSYPGRTGAVEINTLGYYFDYMAGTRRADSVYRLSFTFPHSASAVQLRFSASGLLGNFDEAWGLDNVLVYASSRPAVAVPLVSTGAVWKYLDDGSDQGPDWTATNFVDAAWSSGPAQLGYGDGDEATVISFGPDANNKYITTYFRRSFSVTNASTYTNLTLRLLRDDGAVVYLNGVEVFRSNLPAGPITFTTLASTDISGAVENTFVTASLNPARLVNGTNVLAVEVHQSAPNSDDLSFDLEIIGIRTP